MGLHITSPLYCTFYVSVAASGTLTQAKSLLAIKYKDSLRMKTYNLFIYLQYMLYVGFISLSQWHLTLRRLHFSAPKNPIKASFLHTPYTLFCNFVFFPHSGKSVKQGRLFGSSLERIMRNGNSWSCCFCSRRAPSRVPHVSKCTILHKDTTEYRLLSEDQTDS